MAKVNCTTCGKEFDRKPALVRRYKRQFCSQKCNATKFASKHEPWNKNKKGIHLSPKSEFKKGRQEVMGNQRPTEPIGTVKIRWEHPERGGQKRAWIKTAHRKWEKRYRVVWEQVNGKIPRGYVIHHKDRNALNDDIDNLECLTKAQHMNEHRHEFKN